MAIMIKTFGWIIAYAPDSVLLFFIKIISGLFFIFPSRRKYLLQSNLRYAIPDWSDSKIKKISRESFARTIEMGLFAMAYPFFSNERKRRSVYIPKETDDQLELLKKSGKPVLFLLPHLSLFETLAISPFFKPSAPFKLGAIFRPNRNKKIDHWIDQSRQRAGVVTFSRKEGLLKAKKFLKEGNWLVVLFDQNAGNQGVLDLFLDRLVSYTSLPNSLCKATNAAPIFAFPKRTGFFQTELTLQSLSQDCEGGVSADAHLKLQNIIRNSNNGLPEWLWSHGKWKIHSRVESRYQWIVKRQGLIANRSIERRTNFFVRMPNWLGDVIMALPVLIAIRQGRPDVRFTLVCKKQFVPLLKLFGLSEEYIALPKPSIHYFYDFWKKIKILPENYLLFTNFLKGDIEAFMTRCPQRFGLLLPGRCRPLLTNAFNFIDSSENGTDPIHQTLMWEQMARHFGLKIQVSRQPLILKNIKRQNLKIGIVPGSSNSPQKRWAPENWVLLIKQLSAVKKDLVFHLYGTSQDAEITSRISSSLCSSNVCDHAGRTELSDLAEELASCCLVIGNDTGSMHLANMVGTPVVVLFGPTNLTRTKPFFNPTQLLIKSPDPKNINSLQPEIVYQEIISIM